MAKIAVKQGDVETPIEIIADSVVAISAAIKKIRNSRLNDRAIVVLLQAMDNSISQRDIKAVLANLEDLEKTYIRKKT